MRVFFVGLHFKPDMTALDSKTISGQRIDEIIKRLPAGVKAVKTNLFTSFEMPSKQERSISARLWGRIYSPSDNDLIFLLGGKVSRDFALKHNGVVLYDHPAKVMSKAQLEEYVSTAVKIVNDKLINQ